jgi:hypothetical protein
MRTFFEYKSAVLSLFDNAVKVAVQVGYHHISENIFKIKNDFINKELMVVTCGEMRRGKSSLLTAFLEEDKIFPIDINTCTNVITIVRYGEVEKIEVILEKNNKGEVTYESLIIKRDEIDQYVTEYGNESNNKRINCLNISIPNLKLKEGFVFVDTPGLGSLNFEHAQVTYGLLPNADVMLFVSDAINPLTDSELKFLEKTYFFCKNIIFPLTKSDKAKSQEELDVLIASNRDKICNVTEMKPESVHVIPISNKMKLRYLDKKEEDMLEKSNFPALEQLIWKTIYDNRARIVVIPFLSQLFEEVKKLKSNLNVQSEALNQDVEKTKRLASELQDKAEKKTRLLEGNAKWKNDLQYELSNVSIQLNEVVRQSASDISDKMKEMLEQKGAYDQVESIASDVNEMLSDLVFHTKEIVTTKVMDITERISNELGLYIDINEESMNRVGFSQKETIEYTKVQKTVIDKAIDSGRKITMKSVGGLGIGGVIGGIVGGVIGFVVGGPAVAYAFGQAGAGYGASLGGSIGTVIGAVDVVVKAKEDDLPAIRVAFNNYLSRSTGSIQSGVNLCIRELTKGISDQLTIQIKDQISQIEIVTKQIKENLALSQTEIPKRKTKLQEQFLIVNKLDVATIQLSEEVIS